MEKNLWIELNVKSLTVIYLELCIEDMTENVFVFFFFFIAGCIEIIGSRKKMFHLYICRHLMWFFASTSLALLYVSDEEEKNPK